MATCANEQSTEKRMVDNQNAWIHTDACQDEEEEYEEDEDEDVDFNPFLKETPSPEASSSLSSEIEGLDGDVIDNKTITYDSAGIHLTSKVQNNDAGNPKRGAEGILMQSNVSSERACEKELQKTFHGKQKRRKSDSVSLSEYDYPREKENGSSSGIDTSDAPEGKLSVTTQSEPLINLDDEDAICRRTRARYSLASFTLDELEAFLQETDDEDDLQNVDDEEEYRKFLAAVLQGSNCDGQSTQENENSDDEDEDNDADFEIELEEALESDYDEGTTGKARAGQHEKARRRPETRRNRQQKTFAQSKNKLLAQAKRPLRPLVPILPNGPIAPIPARDWRTLMPETAPTREDGLINGFTPRQIGQLYCLIHEHVQLLIQIYSLCVLDPSRQHIASQLQRLIFEMLQKCKDVIACRSGPHPGFCFHPPCICSSVANEVSQVLTAQCRSSRAAEGVDSPNVPMPTPQNSSPSDETNEHHSNRQVGTSQGVGDWMPFVSGRVLSVLDVAPLHLVGRYMDDVSTAVQEHRRHYVESGCDASYEKEPLFPLPYLPSLAQTNEVLRVSIIPAANMVPSSSSQQQPKKTLAATLVESSKKQSVALVPKEIAKLAQRFFPLFNPSLFPHKPPPAAVASRVLFTDSEDELLALGLMEYNSDWKAIQQRFLPCKSKHQIFVRQKNRCSSKAPENPIKAVRRMKTSPLTAEEIACIQEGLRVFKLDWMSVWKFFVPHRDPSLLPRQWRIALGTQKSYKQDAAKKEKRRLYELKRRRSKAAQENWQLASDKEDYQAEITGAANYSGDENTENAAEAYVHEAFLADWRPGMSDLISSERPCSNHREKDLPYAVPQREDTDNREQPGNYESREVQLPISNVHRLPYGLNNFQQPASHFNHGSESASIPLQRNYPVPGKTLSSSKSEIYLRPYRARRSNNPRLVRLAPDLPPVNLPPSVSVVSQSAFRSSQLGASTKSSIVEGGSGHTGRGNVVVQPPHAAKGVAAHSMIVRGGKSNPSKDRVMNSHQEESGVAKEKYVADERGSDSDLQMHPLLFEAPECGNLPFYPLSGTTSASGSFSFFSENRPQLNLNLCHNPSQANNVSDRLSKPPKTNESTVASGGIDFHPLLQRIDDVNGNLLTAFPSKGRSSQLHKPSDAVKTKSPFTCVSFGDGSKPSTANDRANGLDLEIHLSSASTKHKDINGDGTASPRGTVIVPSAANTSETRNIYSLSHQLAEISPAVCSQLDSGINGSVALSNNISRSNMDDIVDQSHLGIVMEQEELSDSDDEIEEHVEFECEEMDDSEGEEASGGEHIPEMQEKEVASPAHEKVGISVDSDEEQQELRNPTNSRGHISVPGKGNPPLLRLTLTGLGKDSASGSWLSLDPCAPGGPLCRKTKREDNASSKDLAVKNLVSCRSSRSSKRTTPSLKKVTVPKHAMDMAQQLSLGPLAVPTLKKPRKHICRANANLNVATTTSSRDERKDNFR